VPCKVIVKQRKIIAPFRACASYILIEIAAAEVPSSAW